MRWILFQLPDRRGPPVIEDTVRYLGAVAAEYEECDDVTEWAYEYGFDPGHLDTREAFNALDRLNRDLWRLVGDPMYEELRQGIAIEQAVDMAWRQLRQAATDPPAPTTRLLFPVHILT